jgi:hypothetical protein
LKAKLLNMMLKIEFKKIKLAYGLILWTCYLGNRFFCIANLRLDMKSIATNCMPDVVSDLSYDTKKMLESCPQVAN